MRRRGEDILSATEKHRVEKECISGALYELMELQDYIKYSRIPYFGKLLARLIEVDTIPFLLMTKDGFLEMMGIEENLHKGKKELFKTKYFRIEEMEENGQCAKVSLLRSLDIYGEDTNVLCDVAKLRKTAVCIEIDLSCICGIQCVDIDLLKRDFIIEPKW